MIAVAVVAVLSALMAWGMQQAPGNGNPLALLGFFAGPMMILLGFDAYFLSHRARAGRPPFGPDFRARTFARDFWIILACLYLPFLWVLTPYDWMSNEIFWATMLPILPGFCIHWPLNWFLHSRSILELPLVILTATLLIAGLARLAIRGRLGMACFMALLVAIPSSLLAQAFYRF